MKTLWNKFVWWCDLHFDGVIGFLFACVMSAVLLFMTTIVVVAVSQIKNAEHPEILEKNRATLSTDGTVMGNLPDGRQVRLYKIDRGNERPHYIYVIDRANTTSFNMDYKQDKQTRSQTVVTAELEE